MAEFPAPDQGILLTHVIVSDDVERSRRFYTEVLGGETVRADRVSGFLNIRVADIEAVYPDWSARGAARVARTNAPTAPIAAESSAPGRRRGRGSATRMNPEGQRATKSADLQALLMPEEALEPSPRGV